MAKAFVKMFAAYINDLIIWKRRGLCASHRKADRQCETSQNEFRLHAAIHIRMHIAYENIQAHTHIRSVLSSFIFHWNTGPEGKTINYCFLCQTERYERTCSARVYACVCVYVCKAVVYGRARENMLGERMRWVCVFGCVAYVEHQKR